MRSWPRAPVRLAAGWPPGVRAWLAEFHELLGDPSAALIARRESASMWSKLVTREDLPVDLIAGARTAAAAAVD